MVWFIEVCIRLVHAAFVISFPLKVEMLLSSGTFMKILATYSTFLFALLICWNRSSKVLPNFSEKWLYHGLKHKFNFPYTIFKYPSQHLNQKFKEKHQIEAR